VLLIWRFHACKQNPPKYYRYIERFCEAKLSLTSNRSKMKIDIKTFENRIIRSLLLLVVIPFLVGFTDDEWMVLINKTSCTIFYVALDGNDRWSGLLPMANMSKTDGPFATLERARDTLRELRRGGKLPDGAVIYVRGGKYYLERTFTLGPEDSGTEQWPIRYLAYKDENPILSGAKEIQGFKPYKDKILQADLKKTALCKINFSQLFANGQRQILARYPNYNATKSYGSDFIYVDDTVEQGSKRKFQYSSGTVHDWARPEEGEIFIFPGPNYWNNIIPIRTIDKTTRIITLAGDTDYPIRKGDRYFIQNLLEELDSPGEWYLDRRSRILYYWPSTSSDINQISVTAPALESVIGVTADPVTKDAPEHIMIVGFTVEACEGTAIIVNGARNCLIARNVVRNSGKHGIVINGGSQNYVIGNDIYETGSAGISISGGDRKTLLPSSHHARNNHIHGTGRLNKYYGGIECIGVGNAISHNLINETPQAGITFDGNDHIIEYNHVHHVNQETEDSGIIYTCARDWTKRGNAIKFNYLHDSGGYGRRNINEEWQAPFQTWGIYLDDWTSGTNIYGNITVSTYNGGVFVHGGRDNTIENNILVEGTTGQAQFTARAITEKMIPEMFEKIKEMKYTKYRELDTIKDVRKDTMMSNNKFIRNIIYYSFSGATLYTVHAPYIDSNMVEFDFNTIFHNGLPLLIPYIQSSEALHWQTWRAKGFDTHSVVADPLFVDPADGDFDLRPDSPAYTVGFKPIVIENAGLYKHPLSTIK